MRFWLGTHQVNWLWDGQIDAPLFISRRRLCVYKSFKGPALMPWVLDSGGFSELSMYGRWTLSPDDYIKEVRRYAYGIGGMQWAAVQDWMCEPQVRAKTKKTVQEHQRLTVESYLELSEKAPDIQWVPVLQGWEEDDYLRHVELYEQYKVPLVGLSVVGVGSVCRRQHTDEICSILSRLYALGLQMHGFGVKLQGLRKYAPMLKSADSMAWSYAARKREKLPECTHKKCSNCPKFAQQWYDHVITSLGDENERKPRQRELFPV